MIVDRVPVIVFAGLGESGQTAGTPLDRVLGQGWIFGVILIFLDVLAQGSHPLAQGLLVFGVEILFRPSGNVMRLRYCCFFES